MSAQRESCDHPALFVQNYWDYRSYLEDYYRHEKSRRRSFSYRSWATQVGFASHNHLRMVIAGKRELSLAATQRVGKSCGQNRDELKYFSALVRWNQCKQKAEDRENLFQKVIALKDKSSIYHYGNEQLKVVLNWKTMVILESLRIESFAKDPLHSTANIRLKISKKEIESCLDELLRCGLIEQHGAGFSVKKDAMYYEGHLPNPLVRRFHEAVGNEALDALINIPAQDREFGALTLSLNEAEHLEIKAELREFQAKILKIAARSKNPDSIHQLNVQFFPVLNKAEEHSS